MDGGDRCGAGFVRGDANATPVTSGQGWEFAQIDVVLALDLPLDVESLARQLWWAQVTGAGIGQFDTSGVAETGIRLPNAAGNLEVKVAEFVLVWVVQHAKRIPAINACQRDLRWQLIYGRPVAGQTIRPAGLGAINKHIAQLARAFVMRAIACWRGTRDAPKAVGRLDRTSDLAEMVAS